MELKEIITDEIELSERSNEIDTRINMKLMREIVSNLKNVIRKNNLKALSAPAIGYKARIFCVNFTDLEIKTYINPIVIEARGMSLSRESCTSIPNKEFIVPRNTSITLMYMNPQGKPTTREFVGAAAYVIQHELQHLDGVTLMDLGLEVDADFDNATNEEREEIINMYLDSLDIRAKELNTEIENDSELSQVVNATKFIDSVKSGETKLLSDEEFNGAKQS